MKNLKKVLCLALAFTLLLGVMVVTTSAANFTDNSEIVNTEAVDTMVALNIINGKGDGSYFDPTGIVTRAEMCKMICVALNGGKDPQLGTTSYSYTDTVGNWAAGYIEYCTNLGIVAGRGNGIFDPTGTVTGTEAAKMLLVAIGYDADAEGFTGASWAIAVNVRANQKDFYTDLEGIDPSAGLTRDNAAQMVYNAIQAVMVKYTYQLTTVDGQLATVAVAEDVTDDPTTILAKKFDMVTKYAYLLGMSYDSDKGKFTYSYDTTGIATADALTITLKSATDYSALYGMKVKVMYKNNTAKDVYGVYAEDSQVLASGVVSGIGTVKSDSFKFGGVVYKLDSGATSSTPIYIFSRSVDTLEELDDTAGTNVVSSFSSSLKPFAVKIIDKDGDGKVDYLIATPFTVAKVTYVGSTTITAGTSYTIEDCDIYDGIAKNDYAIIYDADQIAKGKDTLVKASVVQGEATALETTTKVYIEGTAYNKSDVSYIGDAPSDTFFSLGSTYKLVVVNGYYFYASKVSTAATSTNVCLIYNVATSLDTFNSTLKTQLLMADGTKSTIYVSTVGGSDVAADSLTKGTLYTYEIDSDGYYELTAIAAADYDSYAVNKTLSTIKDGKAIVNSTSYYFADDAVVYYWNGSAYKVTTGATVNNWADISTSSNGNYIYANDSSGFHYAELAKLVLAATPDTGDQSYGWVTAAPVLVKDGDDYYLQMKIWDGSTTTTYLADSYYNTKTSSSSGSYYAGWTPDSADYEDVGSTTVANTLLDIAKGCPVVFSDNGDGTISDVYGFKSAVNAVVGYAEGSSDVAFEYNTIDVTGGSGATTATITDDTVILYVDTANNAGVAGGEIAIADQPDDYTLNCYVLVNADDEIKVIVVDTANKADSPTTPYYSVI